MLHESKGSVLLTSYSWRTANTVQTPQSGRCFRPLTRLKLMIIKQIPCESPVSFHRFDRISAPISKRTSLTKLVLCFCSFKSVSKFLPRKLSVSARVILSQFACSSKKKTINKVVPKWEKHNYNQQHFQLPINA